jgi:hypothetical protein
MHLQIQHQKLTLTATWTLLSWMTRLSQRAWLERWMLQRCYQRHAKTTRAQEPARLLWPRLRTLTPDVLCQQHGRSHSGWGHKPRQRLSPKPALQLVRAHRRKVHKKKPRKMRHKTECLHKSTWQLQLRHNWTKSASATNLQTKRG